MLVDILLKYGEQLVWKCIMCKLYIFKIVNFYGHQMKLIKDQMNIG